MTQCENGIFKNIESQCSNRTSAGIEQTVYLLNRKDFYFHPASDDEYNKIDDITPLGTPTPTAYTAKGFKRNLTAGFERVVSADTVDTWKDSLTLTGYEFDSASARNFDNIGDVVAIIERKGTKEGDGTFIILGLENGLFVSADSWAAGDNNGARVITLSNLDDAGESCAYYVFVKEDGSPSVPDYLATKQALEELVIE